MDMNDETCTCRDLDERLAAYVDGDAPPAARRPVDEHLSACPACRERMEAERAAHQLLHDSRVRLRVAAPSGLRARCAAHQVPRRGALARRWVPLSLAATLVLAIGGVFLLGINDRVQALATGLTLDHVKCFKIGVAPGRSVAASVVGRAWERDQGWPIAVPDNNPSQHLKLVDVRRCYSTDGQTAHLMYMWRGEPLSVYILPHSSRSDRMLDSMGHQTAIWSDNGRTYAVLATGHPDGFTDIVDYVRSHAR